MGFKSRVALFMGKIEGWRKTFPNPNVVVNSTTVKEVAFPITIVPMFPLVDPGI